MANLKRDLAEGVLTLTIDREERRNALNREVLEELLVALREADEGGEVRAVILRGAGDRAFCAGADLGELLAHESIERAGGTSTARAGDALHASDRAAGDRARVRLCARRGLRPGGGLRLHDRGRERPVRPAGDRHRPAAADGVRALYRALGSRKALLDLVLSGRRLPRARRRPSAS
jgi:enoyl-CoA hydratase